jgi:C4-dicarboxylate-specific signal transduction histidine kinase
VQRWFGLRARVAVNLAAAASLAFALTALLSVAIIPRATREAENAALTTAANLLASQIETCTDETCVLAEVARADRIGLWVELHESWAPGPLATTPHIVAASPTRGAHLSTERRIGARVIEVEAPLTPMMARARSALTALLVTLSLNAFAIIVLGTLLLERGVISRLIPVRENMARIERFDLDEPLMGADDGDEIGRMTGTLHRIRARLRDDKRRTTEYIAELEQKNTELRDTREGLAQSERLATVGRLAAGVAHEIGNPIAAIIGYLDILRRGLDTKATGEYLERIERETKRIDRIVRDLLDFARPRPLAIGPVHLSEVVQTALRLVQPQPRWRTMQVVCDIDEKLPPVAAQEHYATQVLLNLFINAADACLGKGKVTVRGSMAPDGRVVLEVADDGPGITPEDLGHIFDPFFTTKPPGEGVGLGLAISYRLMESFGGTIRAANGTPQGALFTLEFRPSAAASAAA